MANVPISNMTVTWTDSGTTYNAIKMNVTDTASNAASLLMDLQVGGTSKFKASKTGVLTLNNSGTITWTSADDLTFSSASAYQRVKAYSFWSSNLSSGIGDNGTPGQAAVHLGSTASIGWTSSAVINANTYDLFLTRDNAANTLAQRNATNAQTFNIYNTYTNASNYERGRVAWESNVFTIGAQFAGTGQARQTYLTSTGNGVAAVVRIGTDAGGGRIWFTPNNISAWAIETTGHFLAQVDNVYDIGASGANRPRNVYVGVDIIAGGSITAGSASLINFFGRTMMISPSDGVMRLSNNAQSDFGRLQFGGTTSSFPSLKRETNTLRVRLADDSGDAQLIAHRLTAAGGILENNTTFYTDNSGVRTSQTGYFGFSSVGLTGGAPDVYLYRDAADTLAQRNTTNAQTFRIYNTYTDASNYERGFIRYASNQLEIGHEVAGTGNGDRLIVIQRPNAGTVLDIKGSTTVAARIGTGVSGFGTAIGVGANGTNPDVFVYRRATAIASLTGNATGTTGAALEFTEQTAPAAPAANGVRIYAEDNGAGKTRLMALFATGVAQQIAIEP